MPAGRLPLAVHCHRNSPREISRSSSSAMLISCAAAAVVTSATTASSRLRSQRSLRRAFELHGVLPGQRRAPRRFADPPWWRRSSLAARHRAMPRSRPARAGVIDSSRIARNPSAGVRAPLAGRGLFERLDELGSVALHQVRRAAGPLNTRNPALASPGVPAFNAATKARTADSESSSATTASWKSKRAGSSYLRACSRTRRAASCRRTAAA